MIIFRYMKISKKSCLLPWFWKVIIGVSRNITGITQSIYFNDNFIPLLKTVSNLDVHLKPIKNTFFGEDNVTVSGLLTGQDIIAQLKEQDLGDMVLFSNRILNEDDTLTLDDMTLDQISQALEVPVRVVGDSPAEFFTAIDHG